jgi:hypothetical protein
MSRWNLPTGKARKSLSSLAQCQKSFQWPGPNRPGMASRERQYVKLSL